VNLNTYACTIYCIFQGKGMGFAESECGTEILVGAVYCVSVFTVRWMLSLPPPPTLVHRL
jgi:hypothetical protein